MTLRQTETTGHPRTDRFLAAPGTGIRTEQPDMQPTETQRYRVTLADLVEGANTIDAYIQTDDDEAVNDRLRGCLVFLDREILRRGGTATA